MTKKLKRYKLVATESGKNVIESNEGHWVHISDVEQLQSKIETLESIINNVIDFANEKVYTETVSIPTYVLADINSYYKNKKNS